MAWTAGATGQAAVQRSSKSTLHQLYACRRQPDPCWTVFVDGWAISGLGNAAVELVRLSVKSRISSLTSLPRGAGGTAAQKLPDANGGCLSMQVTGSANSANFVALGWAEHNSGPHCPNRL